MMAAKARKTTHATKRLLESLKLFAPFVAILSDAQFQSKSRMSRPWPIFNSPPSNQKPNQQHNYIPARQVAGQQF